MYIIQMYIMYMSGSRHFIHFLNYKMSSHHLELNPPPPQKKKIIIIIIIIIILNSLQSHGGKFFIL